MSEKFPSELDALVAAPGNHTLLFENERVRVLEFRETRGWEVRYPFFTDQFSGAHLSNGQRDAQLDQQIDGITGATLSVRAVTRAVQAALYLSAQLGGGT